MRLLIYLLAMMTGFSAAEAARPVSATPAALGSAVAHGAVIAASVAATRDEATSAPKVKVPGLYKLSAAPLAAELLLAVVSPVLRHDITRQ
jgi:hypothetical protein